jgi:hypothetical protein
LLTFSRPAICCLTENEKPADPEILLRINGLDHSTPDGFPVRLDSSTPVSTMSRHAPTCRAVIC